MLVTPAATSVLFSSPFLGAVILNGSNSPIWSTGSLLTLTTRPNSGSLLLAISHSGVRWSGHQSRCVPIPLSPHDRLLFLLMIRAQKETTVVLTKAGSTPEYPVAWKWRDLPGVCGPVDRLCGNGWIRDHGWFEHTRPGVLGQRPRLEHRG